MLIASLIAAFTCCAVSFLSKSALKWSFLLIAGLAVSYFVSSAGLHPYIWAVDLAMLLSMIGARQELNRDWQDLVIRLQGAMTVVYATYAVFAKGSPWLISPLIDVGNILYLVQLAAVGFGGTTNSLRNYRYIRDQRRSGNRLPWLLTAWRMT